MAEALPPELETRCVEIADPTEQGEPLVPRDYLLLLLATVLIPFVLVAVGALL
jgi:hypothetical protein